jgi:hypothetical protein
LVVVPSSVLFQPRAKCSTFDCGSGFFGVEYPDKTFCFGPNCSAQMDQDTCCIAMTGRAGGVNIIYGKLELSVTVSELDDVAAGAEPAPAPLQDPRVRGVLQQLVAEEVGVAPDRVDIAEAVAGLLQKWQEASLVERAASKNIAAGDPIEAQVTKEVVDFRIFVPFRLDPASVVTTINEYPLGNASARINTLLTHEQAPFSIQDVHQKAGTTPFDDAPSTGGGGNDTTDASKASKAGSDGTAADSRDFSGGGGSGTSPTPPPPGDNGNVITDTPTGDANRTFGSDNNQPVVAGTMDLEGQSCLYPKEWTDCKGCHSTGGACGTPSGAVGEVGG